MTDLHIAIRMIGSSILQEYNVPARTGKRNWNNEIFEKLKGVKKLDKKEIEFEFERATKNTYRFQEKASGNPAIGTLYVQKSVFGDKEPKKVKVTVEWE